jgi:hypothetical protein
LNETFAREHRAYVFGTMPREYNSPIRSDDRNELGSANPR